jgi:hypothetical protein
MQFVNNEFNTFKVNDSTHGTLRGTKKGTHEFLNNTFLKCILIVIKM